MIQKIVDKFKLLNLKSCAENLPLIIEQGKQKNLSPLDMIEQLLDLELERREQNRMTHRFKLSRLKDKPTIDQFDFNFHISRKKQKNRILNRNRSQSFSVTQ